MARVVSGDILVEQAFEGGFVLNGEKAAGGQGMAMERGEPMDGGVARGFGFAFGRAGTSGLERIAAIGSQSGAGTIYGTTWWNSSKGMIKG